MTTKRKKLVPITYREFCKKHICAFCPEYNKKQGRCCISTDLRIAENEVYIDQNDRYVFRVKKMKDKTFDNFWEELKSESPETRKELEEAEKNSELMIDIMAAVRNLLDEKDSEKWVSVDFYLPNTDRDVLAYTDTRDMFRCRYNSVGKHWVRDGIFRVKDVTHWRELPDPPRTEEKIE